ncbi:hypothetical protein F5Y15DRAFT_418005 [Xylariaceae sp. FL0016]|nr:hypothetical protein F5Y15DRAFT_418005 [Xylariaceae sp. FL0016]
MSGEGPESIPTSADPRSKRPTKRRALSPTSAQSAHLSSLFARPDIPIKTPPSFTTSSSLPHQKSPPEIVTNVQGSSAGAGSGEFHVYKASRRREYDRLRHMEDEVAAERAREQFDRDRADRDRRDEERTRRNREKRDKKKRKARSDRAGGGGGGGGAGTSTSDAHGNGSTNGDAAAASAPKSKLRIELKRGEDAEEDEEMTQDAPTQAGEEPKGIVIEDD